MSDVNTCCPRYVQVEVMDGDAMYRRVEIHDGISF